MKLLWLSHFIPYPPRGGERQRSFNLLRQISRRYDVHLVAFNRPVASSETLQQYERVFREFCVAVDFWELPYPWKGPHWWAELAISPMRRYPYVYYVYGTAALHRKWHDLLAQNPDAPFADALRSDDITAAN